MKLPPHIVTLMDQLTAHGEQVFVVGGACRDTLLGLTPHDYDLATSATPDRIKAIFSDHKLVLMGQEFGTVGVVVDSHMVELTTFRVESSYRDHRRPDHVIFTRTLDDDLSRRDFTINAIAYHPNVGFVDLHNGQVDMNQRLIRLVGDPHQRLEEDALRALRAIRFASRLDFTIDPATSAAVSAYLSTALLLAKERIWVEWKGIISGTSAARLLTEFAPFLSPLLPSCAVSQIAVLNHLDPDFHLRIAGLFLHSHYSDIQRWWNDWKGDARGLKIVITLVQIARLPMNFCISDVHRWLSRVPYDYRSSAIPLWVQEQQRQHYVRQVCENLLMSHAPLSIRDLVINGHTLEQLMIPAHLRSTLLSELLEAVIDERVRNQRDELIAFVPQLVAQLSVKS